MIPINWLSMLMNTSSRDRDRDAVGQGFDHALGLDLLIKVDSLLPSFL